MWFRRMGISCLPGEVTTDDFKLEVGHLGRSLVQLSYWTQREVYTIFGILICDWACRQMDVAQVGLIIVS